jgi:hypothetical protein
MWLLAAHHQGSQSKSIHSFQGSASVDQQLNTIHMILSSSTVQGRQCTGQLCLATLHQLRSLCYGNLHSIARPGKSTQARCGCVIWAWTPAELSFGPLQFVGEIPTRRPNLFHLSRIEGCFITLSSLIMDAHLQIIHIPP